MSGGSHRIADGRGADWLKSYTYHEMFCTARGPPMAPVGRPETGRAFMIDREPPTVSGEPPDKADWLLFPYIHKFDSGSFVPQIPP